MFMFDDASFDWNAKAEEIHTSLASRANTVQGKSKHVVKTIQINIVVNRVVCAGLIRTGLLSHRVAVRRIPHEASAMQCRGWTDLFLQLLLSLRMIRGTWAFIIVSAPFFRTHQYSLKHSHAVFSQFGPWAHRCAAHKSL